jgi:nucleoside-diphosphate-sugar epimerase
MICAVTGFDPAAIEYDPSQYVGVRHKLLAIARLRAYLPDFTPRPLAEGLASTIDWLRSHMR